MVEDVPPEEVKEKLDAGEEFQIVDIRPEDDFVEGHIPGAVNIPMSRLPAEVQNHDWGDEIVVACPVGESSVQAARLLESYEGVDEDARVANLDGGYAEWDYELEAEEELEAD